jgi:hypothetical protein
VNIVGTVIVTLSLLGASYGLWITLKTGQVPSRYARLRAARAAQPTSYWVFAELYVPWIVAALWVLRTIWERYSRLFANYRIAKDLVHR